MGTTVSNLQILGRAEDAVRAAMPHTLVGTWSKRFVTACPNLSLQQLARTAASLSKRLECTLLMTAMFDGDALRLTLFQNGRRLTEHRALPSAEDCVVGNPKLFCTALGLPEELAPKLRRLFSDCSMQEEKLGILQVLLGTPLFLRWDDDPPEGPVIDDPAPLIQWVKDHPAPPKIKNQCKAELIQEIPERGLEHKHVPSTLIFRPVVRKGDKVGWYRSEGKAGDIIGHTCVGGEWARPCPDGRLERIPLVDPPIPDTLQAAVFPGEHFGSDFPPHYTYTFLDSRMITSAELYPPKPNQFGVYTPYCTVILHDTADILPLPLLLTLEDEPVRGSLHLLPDGGFLAAVSPRYDSSRPPVQIREPALICYGPDGTQRWSIRGIDCVVGMAGGLIYAVTADEDRQNKRLLSIDLNGNAAAQCLIPFSRYGTKIHIIGDTPYLLEPFGYQEDAVLHRLTSDLQPAGEVPVPDMSRFSLSPDGALLCCSGFGTGLQIMDAAALQVIRRLNRMDDFHSPVVDGQNRLWVGNKSYFECYDQELSLISRHRLAGDICETHRNAAGQACVVTHQDRKYFGRVYRFY